MSKRSGKAKFEEISVVLPCIWKRTGNAAVLEAVTTSHLIQQGTAAIQQGTVRDSTGTTIHFGYAAEENESSKDGEPGGNSDYTKAYIERNLFG